MKVMLLVNPSASSVSARRRVIIQTLLSANHDIEVAESNRRGHATLLALDAARRGVECIVVLGGDGTLNEVANGLVGTDCAVAALPGGSTNVFARTLGLSDDPVEAAMSNIDALAKGAIHSVGLGSVNGRYFLFHTGIGWDAALVSRVEKRAEMKRYAGHPLFIWAGLETFFRLYDRRHPHFKVRYADGTEQPNGYFSVVLNSNPYTYVGTRPFNISPDASLDRPLAMVTVTKMTIGSFFGLMLTTLRSDKGITGAKIIDYRADVTSVVIEGYGKVPYQVDGDYLGDIDRLEFAHHPDILRLVMPNEI